MRDAQIDGTRWLAGSRGFKALRSPGMIVAIFIRGLRSGAYSDGRKVSCRRRGRVLAVACLCCGRVWLTDAFKVDLLSLQRPDVAFFGSLDDGPNLLPWRLCRTEGLR